MRTGATEDQIQEAWNRANSEKYWLPVGVCAGYLVPEDARIISVEDLKRLRDLMDQMYSHGEIRGCGDFLQRIDQLIAGDAS